MMYLLGVVLVVIALLCSIPAIVKVAVAEILKDEESRKGGRK